MNAQAPTRRQAVAERRIRTSALLVLLGLVVETISLNILHPLSFLVFLILGGLLAAAGIGWFLFALLRIGSEVT